MEERQGEMSEVWFNLPAELQIKIAEDHLPFSSLCRFRSVSRSWSKPKLRPASLSDLYIRRTFNHTTCCISLCKGKGKQGQLSLLKRGSKNWGLDTHCLNCINGILCCLREHKHQLKFWLCNVFRGHGGSNVFRGHGGTWTRVPNPPRAPGREILFAGMSRLYNHDKTPPRIGVDANLDDYMFVAVTGSESNLDEPYRPIDLLLQVYTRGTWTCSRFDFPQGEGLMFGSIRLRNRCGVLRGSLFYFFMMRQDLSSARLCVIDLLSSDRQCKTVWELEPGLVIDWDEQSPIHPKLAICSGILVMVYASRSAGACTTCIRVFDDESRTWTAVSTLPEELRGGKRFYPTVVCCGGDELFVNDDCYNYGFVYNFATGAWYPVAGEDWITEVIPMSVSY